MMQTRKKLARVGGALFLLLLIVYSAYQARAYLAGPALTIKHTEQNGALLEISGTAERVAFLSLNERQIFTNERGVWQETILLLPGYNIVSLAATDRFGRKVEVYRDFYRNKENI